MKARTWRGLRTGCELSLRECAAGPGRCSTNCDRRGERGRGGAGGARGQYRPCLCSQAPALHFQLPPNCGLQSTLGDPLTPIPTPPLAFHPELSFPPNSRSPILLRGQTKFLGVKNPGAASWRNHPQWEPSQSSGLGWEYPGWNPTFPSGLTDAGRAPTLSRTWCSPKSLPWASYIASLCLSCLVCIMGELIPSPQKGVRFE